jgi:hypothetical protein
LRDTSTTDELTSFLSQQFLQPIGVSMFANLLPPPQRQVTIKRQEYEADNSPTEFVLGCQPGGFFFFVP